MTIRSKLTAIFFLISLYLQAQEAEIDRLMESEFKMTFPSIYFKNKSESYALMPYTADSCFKYIALHFDKSINSLVIWKDSSETADLTNKRIRKLKAGLSKYMPAKNIEIYPVGKEQKISRHTIHMTRDSTKINYLLSLNSVFDISKSRLPNNVISKGSHILHPKIWCGNCWKSGFHLNKSGRELRKMARQNKHKNHKQ